MMVPEVGLEPTRREAGDFESPMYTLTASAQFKTNETVMTATIIVTINCWRLYRCIS